MEACSLCDKIDNCIYLNWKNPKTTGAILGGINLFFFLMALTDLNLFVIATYMLLFYVVSGVVIAQFMEKPGPDDNEYEHISKDTLENILREVFKFFAVLDKYMKRVASLEEISLTIRFFIGLYIFMTVTGWFSDCFVLFLAINGLFLWKPIMKSQGETIRSLCDQGKAVAMNTWATVDAFIPKYKDPSIKTE